MMKKALKRFLAMSCTAALLLTTPGVVVLADEMQEEEVVLSDISESESVQEEFTEENIQEYDDEDHTDDSAENLEDQVPDNVEISEDSYIDDSNKDFNHVLESGEDEIVEDFSVDFAEDLETESLVGANQLTIEQVRNWLNNEIRIGATRGSGECVDFCNYYLKECWGIAAIGGHAYMWKDKCPSGWTPINLNKSYDNCQIGDLIVEDINPNAPGYGHVSVYYGKENGIHYVVDQNNLGRRYTGKGRVWSDFSCGVWCFRPPIKDINPIVSVTFTPWSNDNYTFIDKTNAAIGMEINVSGGTCTKTGMYLYDSNGSYLAQGKNDSYTLARVYFNINQELGYTLKAGTRYKYKFYAIVNGQEYWSNEYSFTTIGPSVSFSPWNNDNYTYIGLFDASIGMEINVSGGTCSKTGMYLYDSNGSYLSEASKSYYSSPQVYFRTNQDCGCSLAMDTVYKYKFYAIVDGQAYWSDEYTFKTKYDSNAAIVGDGVTARVVSEDNNRVLYFDSRGGTLWNNWRSKVPKVNRVEIIKFTKESTKMYLPADSSELFRGHYSTDETGVDYEGLEELKQIDFSKMDTTKVTDMSYMFSDSDIITRLDLSSFDTSRVTNMSGMFFECSRLEELNLSSFDTSHVTNMSAMFGTYVDPYILYSGCSSLKKLDLSNFDTSHVTSMARMFLGCSRLEELNISSFNTATVRDMSYMFAGCNNLTELDIVNFNTSNVTNMSHMFGYSVFGYDSSCENVEILNLSSFDTSKVQNFDGMFTGCTKIHQINTPKKHSMYGVTLPVTMYSSVGEPYEELPVLSESIVLTTKKNISNCSLVISPTSYTYNGKAKKPSVTVTDNTTVLVNGTDYNVTYANNINAGTATVTITGCGSYAGTISNNFTINKAAASLKFASASVEKKSLDAAFTNELTKTTDGTVTFKSSNTAVATVNSTSGKVTIKGIGTATITASATAGTNYKAGSASYTLTVIDGRTDISKCTVTLSATSYTYNGKAKKPTVTVKNGTQTLTTGTDYTIAYSNNTNAGTATVTVTGTGNCIGTNSTTFKINKAAPKLTFASESVSKTISDDAFINELTKTTDGTVTLSSSDTNVATVNSTTGIVTIRGVGTATITASATAGKNYKAGSASYTLDVSGISMENATVGGVSLSYGYSGKAYTPTVTVKVDGVTLTKDTDYKVTYKNNKEPGTATITVTGIGKYTGSRTKTFEIVDCVSSLVSGKTYQLIPKNNSKTAVSAFGGKMVKNTKVYITDRSNSEAMKFKAIQNADGTWKFINAKCEMALAVKSNSSAVGNYLVIYDQTTRQAQNWKLTKKSDNSFGIINAVSGLYIAMSDDSAVKGTTLSMEENSGRGQQRFYIVETTAVNAPFDGTRAVKASKNKNFAVSISGASTEDGANVNLASYSSSNDKKFNIIYSGGGYYRLVNVNSMLVLTVKDNSTANGANVIQSAWAGESGQRWKFKKNSDGTVTLTNALGTVLHLNGNSTTNGTNILAKTASTTGAQKWYLE